MNVEVISATARPLDVISLAAGTCYGKHDCSAKRVRSCYQRGHMSVFEHASATVRVSGISRACSHQLVRHRIASYSQQSQRYCRIDVDGDWFVLPANVDAAKFASHMAECKLRYLEALEAGAKPEDARYLLPEAAKTEITVTMNARELFHFVELRGGKAAQWEIRGLAAAMVDALKSHDRQWGELLGLMEVRNG